MHIVMTADKALTVKIVRLSLFCWWYMFLCRVQQHCVPCIKVIRCFGNRWVALHGACATVGDFGLEDAPLAM